MNNIDLRIVKGTITQKQLAAHMGVTRQTVSNWLNKPSLGEVERQILLIAIAEIKQGK